MRSLYLLFRAFAMTCTERFLRRKVFFILSAKQKERGIFMIGFVNVKKIQEQLGFSLEDLKKMTFGEVLLKDEEAKTLEKKKAAERNAVSEEFANIVKKFFTPLDFLKQWWTEDEIIQAVARNATEKNLVTEHYVTQGNKCYYKPCDYIRTSSEIVKRYTKQGEELLYGEIKMCDVYRIRNQYQGYCHGKIILDLLYGRYPELKKYSFSAYGMNDSDTYEIYPAHPEHVYVPFAALMDGDLVAIEKRNIEYARSFNHGAHSVEKVTERLESPEVQEMFQTIKNMKR